MQYSTEQLVERFEEQRYLRNLMGKISYLGIIKKEKDIFPMLWSLREDVILGVNEGWYLGPEAVKSYYNAYYERTLYTTKFISDRFGDKLGGKSQDELYGVGIMNIKPVDTAVIEVAGDGETAKGVWYCRGSDNDIKPCGPAADWTFGVYAVDFIKEDGVFKVWHMKYLEDIRVPAGKDWGAVAAWDYPVIEQFAEAEPFKLPKPTIVEELMARYTPDRPFTPLPEPPEPYYAFDETFSYGR